MKTIKTSLSKVLTVALVALTVLFSFAVNPGVAEAVGYCCSGEYKQITADYPTCKIEYAPGYEYERADLFNNSDELVVVIEESTDEAIILYEYEDLLLPLAKNDTFELLEGSGPVEFKCYK
ncbi:MULTISPECIES: hypothetical protein [unclassified Moorena]|uniref:hypothetical protein n=1 Tax=unclassified Moorena TaxID=2683338 RepID=UPI0013B6A828|nr:MULTISPECIES: hypothetical protein [unclassified Moorena]NEP35529.1 hypothetical protein [Moorena sp. SIO3B2]NEQ06731.1 hypothetical protein [Moorena sp. SIO4E2]